MGMKRIAIAAAIVALALGAPACAQDYNEAQDALATMAAVKVCKAVVSEEAKRELYGKILSIYRTPSIVSYQIANEAEALEKLPASDRAALCLAIGDRVKP
jgi:hypothetical protein